MSASCDTSEELKQACKDLESVLAEVLDGCSDPDWRHEDLDAVNEACIEVTCILESYDGPAFSWVAPLIAHNTVPHIVRLLRSLVLKPLGCPESASCRPASCGLSHEPISSDPGPAPDARKLNIDHMVMYLVYMLGCFMRLVHTDWRLAQMSPLWHKDRLRTLLSELRLLPVLEAVAEAVRWAVLRPLGCEGTDADNPRMLSGPSMTVLGLAAKVVNDLLTDPYPDVPAKPEGNTNDGPNSTASDSGCSSDGNQDLRVLLLQGLRSSSLVAVLCDGVLAVETVMSGDHWLGKPAESLARAGTLSHVLEVLCAFAAVVRRGVGEAKAGAIVLLRLPEVTRLRLAALEQLAASAPPQPPPGGSRRAPAGSGGGGGSGSHGDRNAVDPTGRLRRRRDDASMAECGGGVQGSSKAAAAATTPHITGMQTLAPVPGPQTSTPSTAGRGTWPLLDSATLREWREQRSAPRRIEAQCGLAAAFTEPLDVLRRELGDPEWRELLPPPPRRVTGWAAACCRAMVMEAAAEWRRRAEAAKAAAERGHGCAVGLQQQQQQQQQGRQQQGRQQQQQQQGEQQQGQALQQSLQPPACGALHIVNPLFDLTAAAAQAVAFEDPAALDEAVLDVLEALGWALRALTSAEGDSAHGTLTAATTMDMLANWLEGHLPSSLPAFRARIADRLLPTHFFASLDCLLRRQLAVSRPDAPPLINFVISVRWALEACLEPFAHARNDRGYSEEPLWSDGVGGGLSIGGFGSACGCDAGDIWKPRHPSPQDDLGLFITLAKLARKETAAAAAALAAAVAAPAASTWGSNSGASGSEGAAAGQQGPSRSTCGEAHGFSSAGFSRSAPVLAYTVTDICNNVCRLLAKLQRQQGGAGGAAGAQEWCGGGGGRAGTGDGGDGDSGAAWMAAVGGRFAAALREALADTLRATLPLLEVLLADDGPAVAWRMSWRSASPLDTKDMLVELVRALGFCLAAAAVVLPPEEVLAMGPPRLLALATRRMREAADGLQTAQRQRQQQQKQQGLSAAQRRAARRNTAVRSGTEPALLNGNEKESWFLMCHNIHVAVVCLLQREGLVHHAASWLRGDQQPGGRDRLDLAQVAAAMCLMGEGVVRKAAAYVLLEYKKIAELAAFQGEDTRGRQGARAAAMLRLLAKQMGHADGLEADLSAFRPLRCSGGSGQRGRGGGRRGGGAGSGRGGGAGRGGTRGAEGDSRSEAPLRVPRLLRLCGNPRCTNFSGPAEGALRLRLCSGCGVVRYCGAECQRQHWREGGHKEECARIREAEEAAVDVVEAEQSLEAGLYDSQVAALYARIQAGA